MRNVKLLASGRRNQHKTREEREIIDSFEASCRSIYLSLVDTHDLTRSNGCAAAYSSLLSIRCLPRLSSGISLLKGRAYPMLRIT